MPGLIDEIVEATAKALWEATFPETWDVVPERWKDEFRRQARVALRGAREALKARSERDGRELTYLDRHVQHMLLEILA